MLKKGKKKKEKRQHKTNKFNFLSYKNIPQHEDETKTCSLKKLNGFVKSRLHSTNSSECGIIDCHFDI